VVSDQPLSGQVLSREGLVNRLLYRDGLMLVVDKPAGIPVHRGPKGGLNLEDLFDALQFGLPKPPALAHRLDRDTSGCLVLGRHPKALKKLGNLFADGRIKKTYWAIVHGTPDSDSGTIDAALAKRSELRGWWMKVDAGGQEAVTHFKVLAKTATMAWLELKPQTGRTHQIRVHLAHIGCPIIGDPIYGLPQDKVDLGGPPKLMLHARTISIPLYANREPIEVTAEPPAKMADLLAGFAAP
jgi:tRNA pseudouridine32 synthase/23S rRNA pseudouridine746 synthase